RGVAHTSNSISDLRYFRNPNAIIPDARQVLLSHFKTKLNAGKQWLLISIQNLRTVGENRFSVEIGKRHLQLNHPQGFVRKIFKISGNDINLLPSKVFACGNAEMRQLQIILNR